MDAFDLHWLPETPAFNDALRSVVSKGTVAGSFEEIKSLATARLDFIRTARLDRAVGKLLQAAPDAVDGLPAIKIGLLSSCTVDHLLPSIRVGGLRRKLLIDCYVAPYGQYMQEVLNPASGLHAFAPDVVLLNLDSASVIGTLPLTEGAEAVERALRDRVDEIRQLWRRIRDDLGAVVIQQSILDQNSPLFGNFELHVPAAPTRMVQQFNWMLAAAAAADDMLWLDLDWWVRQIGSRQFTDTKLWHQAKQEISPMQAPLFGDLLARQLAAIRGLSYKCLVLDLDNTLWGGVIGDDGLEGIVLGQGNPVGEAFVAFQRYAKRLSERGIILAVCSKNEQDIAESAFREHPEMVLSLSDIAAFVANWQDKPGNLQRIAEELNIGVDALVFFDDNPAERALVRDTLPDVAVPEAPEAAESYVQCLADAGYFETVSFTPDDTKRTQQYVANRERKQSFSRAADLESFLGELEMEMQVAPFDRTNLPRIVQLINKTNQFNLTTRRYTEAEVLELMADESVETFCFRLKDRFGDNGIICIVIGRLGQGTDADVMEIDTWLMSCRVLGRRVENAVLNILAETARKRRAAAIAGRFVPTKRNRLVREHYKQLGFGPASAATLNGADDETRWTLPLAEFEPQYTDLFEVAQAHGTE